MLELGLGLHDKLFYFFFFTVYNVDFIYILKVLFIQK